MEDIGTVTIGIGTLPCPRCAHLHNPHSGMICGCICHGTRDLNPTVTYSAHNE